MSASRAGTGARRQIDVSARSELRQQQLLGAILLMGVQVVTGIELELMTNELFRALVQVAIQDPALATDPRAWVERTAEGPDAFHPDELAATIGVAQAAAQNLDRDQVEELRREFGASSPLSLATKTAASPKGGDRDVPARDRDRMLGASILDEKIVPWALAEQIRNFDHIESGFDGRLYRYRDGVYHSDGERLLVRRIREIAGPKAKKALVQEALQCFKGFDPVIPATPPAGALNVANGLIEPRTGALRKHSPSFKSATQIPIAYCTDAECQQIDNVVLYILDNDDGLVSFFWEVCGLALYPANPFQKAILLYGGGGNGKTTLLRILIAIVGEMNVAHVSLSQLSENRFAAAELVGRTANICGDLDSRYLDQTDRFKQITGGDPIMAERKHGQPFSFNSIATPIFSTNTLPVSSDMSDAWFDRWLVVPCTRQIRGAAKEEPMVLERILQPEELEGGLARAVAGLQRLLDRRGFKVPKAVQDASAAYREDVDPVHSFIRDRCEFEAAAMTVRARVYESYSNYCATAGRGRPLSTRKFYERIRRDFGQRISERKAVEWYLDGLRLRDES